MGPPARRPARRRPNGGSLDRLAPLLTPLLGEALGKPIEARNDTAPDAAEGLAGVAAMPSSEVRPALATNNVVVATRRLGYGANVRPLRDVDGIGVLARLPNAVVVRGDHPAGTLAEWVAWAGPSGRPLRNAAGAPGSMRDLAACALAERAKVTTVKDASAAPQSG